MKINASEIRVGMLLEYKDDLWQVLKTQHVKPGKGGAFAQIEGDIEGLIHISELSDKRITHPKEAVEEGQILELKILSLEPERHRLGLSRRRVVEEM